MGVSVKGAIVIARYGASWRGIKPKVAAEHGASAASSTPIRATMATYQGDHLSGRVRCVRRKVRSAAA
jgi:hypothetical protein